MSVAGVQTCALPIWSTFAIAARANVDQRSFGTLPVGTFADDASPFGCRGMIGDTWEWTASGFHAYPGFSPYPYREYSEAFFRGDYRVLRGGSGGARRGGAPPPPPPHATP